MPLLRHLPLPAGGGHRGCQRVSGIVSTLVGWMRYGGAICGVEIGCGYGMCGRVAALGVGVRSGLSPGFRFGEYGDYLFV